MSDDKKTGNSSNDGPTFSSGHVVQAGNVYNVFQAGSFNAADRDELATQRQSFLFEFYRQALKQAETTFRMSLIFMSIGAIVVISGGLFALLYSGLSGRDYMTLMPSLGGIIISACGGAFALHANRARKHLTRQAEKMENDLQSDRTLEQALRLIDQVDDDTLKDRLKSITAMRTLGLGPNPETVTNRLLPQREESSNEQVADGRNIDAIEE